MTARAPSHDELLRLDAQLCFPLYAATNMLTRVYRPLLEPLGLTYPQYLVMLVLWESGGETVKSLGERLHLDSGTLTPLLKRLEAGKLVRRRRDTEDERRVVVTLTPQGQAMKAKALRVPQALICRLLDSGEDVASISTLQKQLQGLVAALSDSLADQPSATRSNAS